MSNQPATPERHWLSKAQAADHLGVTERTIRAWIARGTLPASRPRGSRLIRIARSDLDALMQPIRTTGDGS